MARRLLEMFSVRRIWQRSEDLRMRPRFRLCERQARQVRTLPQQCCEEGFGQDLPEVRDGH